MNQDIKDIEQLLSRITAHNTAGDDFDFFKIIVENNEAELVVLDRDQRYVYLNPHAIKDPELREWLIGKTDFDYCAYRNKPITLAQSRSERFQNMLRTKKAYSFEETFELDGGRISAHLRRIQPILNQEGEVAFAIGYSLDVSQVKMQEKLINLQKEAINNSPEGIAILDPAGRYVFMNRAHEILFGYAEGGLIGKHWHTIYTPEEVARVSAVAFPVLEKEGIWRGETTGISVDGKSVLQEITLRLFPDYSLICVTRDISQIKRNYQLLEAANQKLELAISAGKLGMWQWLPKQNQVSGNEFFIKLFGKALKEELGTSMSRFLNLVHPGDREQVYKTYNLLLNSRPKAHKSPETFEFRVITSSNTFQWVMSHALVSEFDKQGKPEVIIGFLLDTNQTKKAEHDIRESEKKYKELVENLSEIVFETNARKEFTFLNKAWVRLTGYSHEEALGSSIYKWIDSLAGATLKEHIKTFKKNKSVSKISFETSLTDNQGQSLWFDIKLDLRFDEYDTVIGTRGSMEDITSRKNAELELQNALKRERELNDLKSRFVNMVSHELRTPLAGIRSSAELISLWLTKTIDSGSKANQAVSQKIEHILSDADRITSLITDVLTLGQIEAAKVQFNPGIHNFKDFLSQYLNLDAPRYVGQHAIQFSYDTEDTTLRFDPAMLGHLFNNLLSNAAKYSPSGKPITFTVNGNPTHYIIEISDKGIGIPDKDLSHLFDTFFRSSNVENIPGTGLGLPIAKYFTELHNGSIEISSKLGKGTKVIIHLPKPLIH